MKTLKTITCITALVAGLGILPSKGAVIFEGTTWYNSGTSTNLTVNSGTMTSTTGASGSFALSYIPTKTLTTAGQTLTYTVDFSLTGTNAATSNGLRFGLFNSGGSQISADNQGLTNATYNGYTGYAAAFGNQSVSNSNLTSALWDRTSTNNQLIQTFSGVYTSGTSASTSTGSPTAMSAGNDYHMTLTLTYNSPTDMLVSSTLTGGTLGTITRSYTDTTPVTNFDTVVLFSSAAASSSLIFSNVSVVPEPATASLLLGAIGLLLVRKSRRLISTPATRR